MDKSALYPIADDIYQVPLPLPFALRIVNCYLLRGSAGWSIIDTGLHTPDGEAGWRTAFDALHIVPGDLEQIIVTHHHPDHYGMAGWLQTWNGAPVPVWMAARERSMVEQVWWEAEAQRTAFSELMRSAGVDEALLTDMLAIGADIRSKTAPHPVEMMRTFAADATLTIGARTLRVIIGPGHSVGQAMLYDEADALLFSADHVLMKITPNVGLWPGSDADPLASFLRSLADLEALPVRLALPGHKTLIHDWRGRLTELRSHHADRLDAMSQAAGRGATALQIARSVFDFRQFTFHEMRFAVAETLAHLEYLRLRDRLQRSDAEPAWRYALPG